MSATAKKLDWLQPAVLAGSLVPFAVLTYRAFTGRLGANPIETGMNQLGLLALVFLLASLSCTPLKIVFGIKWPLRLRKTLGLMAFFTVLSHFLVYLVLDQVLMIDAVIEDIIQRPFILVGFAAFMMLIPLALTSTKRALQRLGPKSWQSLHRLVYLIGIFGVVHFVLRVKRDVTEPLIYGAVLALLLGIRVLAKLRRSAA